MYGRQMQVPGRIVPWVFLLIAALAALWTLAVTGPTACGETQLAFNRDVTTKSSTTLEFLADHCTIIWNSDGTIAKDTTIVNWSGILAALSLLAGGWYLGALIGSQVTWKRGLTGLGLASGAMLVALVTFFA